MAQANFTPIQLYYSSTTSAAPSPGNLASGELAINITDGKLFYKDISGNVQVIATKGSGTIGGTNTQVQYNSSGALAGSSNFTFNGTTATINTLNLTNALGVAYGGTNSTATPTAGAVPYGTGTAYAFTSAGTSGQALRSGGSGAPTFGTLGTGAGGTGLTTFSANQLFYASSSSVVGQSANLTFVNDNLSVNGITIGRGAGAVSTNTAAWSTALAANTTGNTNTAVGFAALNANTQGNSNTAIGSSALIANTTGGNNTAVGRASLTASITGNNNTAVGSGSLFTADGAASNTAIGYAALFSNTTGNSNTGVGDNALTNNTTGDFNVAVGTNALTSNISGSGNTAISPVNSSGTYSPVFNPTTQSHRFCMGSTSVTNAYIQVAWTVVSDARDKINFAPVPHGLAFVNQLNPTQFQFAVSRTDPTPHGPVRYGFKAQEILALEGNNPVIIDAEDPEKLRYQGESLVPVLVKAIQELSARIEALEAK